MTGDKKEWFPDMAEAEKKTYKIAMRMLETGILEDYDDVSLNDGPRLPYLIIQAFLNKWPLYASMPQV